MGNQPRAHGCGICKKEFASPGARDDYQRAKHGVGKRSPDASHNSAVSGRKRGDRASEAPRVSEEQLRRQFPMGFSEEVNRALDAASTKVVEAYKILCRTLDELSAIERSNETDHHAVASAVALVVEPWRRRGSVHQPFGEFDLDYMIERVQANIRAYRRGDRTDGAEFRVASRVFELVLDGCAESSAERRVARLRAEREVEETLREKERGTYQMRGGFQLGGAAMPNRRRRRT